MTDDHDDESQDERLVELDTIKAIYPELVVSKLDPHSATIDLQIEPIQPLYIQFPLPSRLLSNDILENNKAVPINATTTVPNGVSHAVQVNAPFPQIHHLSHLPPLTVNVKLPKTYPEQTEPEITLTCDWLPSTVIQELRDLSRKTWEEAGGEQMVFAYLDVLREQAEGGFGLGKGESEPLDVSADLEVPVLDFDRKTKRAKFEEETFECGICLVPKKGLHCYRLAACSHVFCVQCLQDYFDSCITEGDVGRVKCTAPDCGLKDQAQTNGATPALSKRRKQDRTLDPSELLEIPLDQENVQRYVTLKRKKRLESDKRTIYCPRQWCQGPARSKKRQWKSQLTDDDGDDDEAEPATYDPNETAKLPPPEERLAICEDCNFAFCKVCKASWHGEFYSCFPRSQSEITAEERATEEYMKSYTQPCPTCDARAQKTHGCNHMICAKCDTHFCYLCGAYLERDNPYQHFNTKGRDCFMRLWELEAGDGEGVRNHFFEGGQLAGVEDDDDDLDIVNQPGPAEPPNAMGRPPDNHQQARQQQPVLPAAAPGPAAEPPRPPEGEAAGLRGGARAAAQAGLQRFLRLAHEDQEDEWDSDEMDDDDDAEELGGRWIG